MKDLSTAALVAPNSTVKLSQLKPDETFGLSEKNVRARTEKQLERLAELATQLAANGKRSLLVVVQGMDGSGKDSVVKHCLGAISPMQVRIAAFKAPTSTELAHDFLWRIHAALPERGQIGIFNRSHYEDVLVVRVEGYAPADLIERRYGAINQFEELLVDEGTLIVKFHLHISKEEQAAQLQQRIADPTKNWKFQVGDLDKRKKWDAYAQAYEIVLERTSTDHAPWHCVPCDHRWVRDAIITDVLVATLADLKMTWPELPPELKNLKIT